VELGEVVGKQLVQLQPDHDSRYIGLSNIYAVARRWQEAKKARKAMEERGLKRSLDSVKLMLVVDSPGSLLLEFIWAWPNNQL
jgi:hypothetical protein